MSKILANVWLQGFIAGLQHCAFYQDGIRYISDDGTTLEEAIEWAKREYDPNAEEPRDA